MSKSLPRILLTVGICSLFAISIAFAQNSGTATSKSSSSHRHAKRRHAVKVRGQKKIDAQRAQQIQEALIREHYLDGEATGVWDDASQKAMQKYQAANGWQTKEIPDSRALIKLGLGPDPGRLLNPDSAMTMTSPPQLSSSDGEASTTTTGQRK